MVEVRRNSWIQDVLKVQWIGFAPVDWLLAGGRLCVKDYSKIIDLNC